MTTVYLGTVLIYPLRSPRYLEGAAKYSSALPVNDMIKSARTLNWASSDCSGGDILDILLLDVIAVLAVFSCSGLLLHPLIYTVTTGQVPR